MYTSNFDTIIDGAIQLSKTRIDSLQQHRAVLGSINFAKEYATVSLNIGRQVGHSMAIARRATNNDVVFSFNRATADQMKHRLNFFNFHEIESYSAKSIPEETYRKYDTIWIDSASVLQVSELDAIYKTYADSANQFVLLG